MPRGRHRPTQQTYAVPLIQTWESSRTQYAKPTGWVWLTRWLHRG